LSTAELSRVELSTAELPTTELPTAELPTTELSIAEPLAGELSTVDGLRCAAGTGWARVATVETAGPVGVRWCSGARVRHTGPASSAGGTGCVATTRGGTAAGGRAPSSHSTLA